MLQEVAAVVEWIALTQLLALAVLEVAVLEVATLHRILVLLEQPILEVVVAQGMPMAQVVRQVALAS
tara:strand:+ start:1371 stop:1571 length:201 start_codon:yes stop_codon:yes gene_type:complete